MGFRQNLVRTQIRAKHASHTLAVMRPVAERPVLTVAQVFALAQQLGRRPRGNIARMGHDSERAAMICQHRAQGADQATADAIALTSKPSRPTRETTRTAALAPWSRSASCTIRRRRPVRDGYPAPPYAR